MPNFVFIAASIDGFIAKKDGDVNWLTEIPNPNNSDYGYKDFIKDMDAIVMGRNSYEKVITFDEWIYSIPVFVLTNKETIPLKDNTGEIRTLKGEPAEITSKLNSEGYNNLYIDGGITIQKFLNADLIDKLIITRIPILLGNGIPLFGLLADELKFGHIKTEVFDNSLVQSWYKRKSS